MSKFKEYRFRPKPVGTESKVKMWCGFTELGLRGLFSNLRREDGSSGPIGKRPMKEIFLISP